MIPIFPFMSAFVAIETRVLEGIRGYTYQHVNLFAQIMTHIYVFFKYIHVSFGALMLVI